MKVETIISKKLKHQPMDYSFFMRLIEISQFLGFLKSMSLDLFFFWNVESWLLVKIEKILTHIVINNRSS